MSKPSLFTLAALAVSSTAAAQNPKFEFAKADEVEKVKDVEWNASAEAGLVFTTGNSETTTVSAGFKAARKTGRNKLSIDGNLTYARSGLRVLEDLNGNGLIDNVAEIRTVSSVTAETLAGKIRYDRFLTKSNSLYVATLGSRDLPAGKEAVIGAQAGYSRRLHKSEKTEAVAELGYDFSYEDLVSGSEVAIHSARGFVGLKSEMTEGTTFDASAEALTNLNTETLPTCPDPANCDDYGTFGKDTRVNARAAISAKIGKNLSVQTSIELRFDNRPAPLAIKPLAEGFVPEASKFDSTMKASLIYTIF